VAGPHRSSAEASSTEQELTALTQEYEASRARWELAIDAAGIASFDFDLATGQVSWDDRLLEMFAYDGEEFDSRIESFTARIHPDDVARIVQLFEHAIETCGAYEAEYRLVLPDAQARWVQARGRVLCDAAGRPTRLVGASYDTTAVHEGEARVARVMEAMSAAFISLDREWRFNYVNAEAERILARGRDELLSKNIWELFPTSVGSTYEEHYRRAVETREPTTFEAYYPAPLNRWYEIRASPWPDGLAVQVIDVTDRHLAQEESERAARRATLLAEITSELSTLDADVAVARLARLVVPILADWCVVTLVDDDAPGPAWERLRDIGSWHRDPQMRRAVERYAELRLKYLTQDSYLARALTTGRPVTIPESATEAVIAVLRPGEARELISRLAPERGAVLPLRAHGRTLGLLTLFSGADAGDSAVDLSTALEVAGRAGLALDNARLYGQQRRLAEGLQRSLLTAPPEPDHLQLVVRYEPAAEAAQVGGDWYDAFLQTDGATVLVIGDVVGHDTEAAAAMGQVRGLLRGIAATTGEGPAQVLSRLDAAMALLQVNTTATVVVARIEQTDDERRRGITRLRWSNAGHPPPMAINPDGSVTVLAPPSDGDADLLLGIDPSTDRRETQVMLERGSTVLLYTDGLVERRGQPFDEGSAKLRVALAELADCPVDELCDQVLHSMLPAHAEDDVALVAVRLHRQDQPRPPEAGPEIDGPSDIWDFRETGSTTPDANP
jgi:PAS domain S-box-containing protein